VKVLAAKLGHLNDHATTHGEHYPIGELYGFKLLVKTEDTMKEGLFLKENRFFVEGEGHVKYAYNNGHIANDPKLAVNYFIHALERIPTLIENYQKKNVELSKDLPVLQEIAKSSWRKEDELKELKSELSALNRKIDLSLKPIDTSEDKDKEQTISTPGLKPPEQPKETEAQRAVSEIQGLMSGKMSVNDYKKAMGERLVIASVPKLGTEKMKGFKL
jgi:hypothetical protein